MSLFETALPGKPEDLAGRPLADRMRPQSLEEYVGQEHILGPGKPLRAQIENGHLTSLIRYGGCREGKAYRPKNCPVHR